MKRIILWSIFILAWLGYMATDVHCATTYYNTTAQGAGTGTNAANAKALSSLRTDVLAASCGDNFYIAAGATYSTTSDFLAIDQTGCTSGSKITIRKDPSASSSSTHPLITGDWSVSAYDTGDAGIRLYENVDYVDIIDIDLRGFRVGLFTGDNTLSNGMSQSNDADGKNNNITIGGSTASNPVIWDQMQMGMVIYGVNNTLCGPSVSACSETAELVSGATGAWTVQNMQVRNFSHRAFLIRNGVGDSNTNGSGNGLTFQNILCDGGGATWDKSGSQTGQGCFDIGQSSATTGTPDSNIVLEDITCNDLNNRNHGSESSNYRNGDCVKTEPETNNIIIRRLSSAYVVDSCVDSKSVNMDIYDSVCTKSTHCWKSYSSNDDGRQTRGYNLLCHDIDNPGGTQAAHSIQVLNGYFSCENCSNININESGTAHYKIQRFSTSSTTYSQKIVLVDSLTSQDSSGGTGLDNDGFQYSSECGTTVSGNPIVCTTVITNGTATETDNYPNLPTTHLMYDGEGATTSGTNPGFGTMDEEYYDVNDTATCQAFEPTNAAYANVGFRCVSPITPFTVPGAPSSLVCAAASDTVVNCSWTAPTTDTYTPFVTGYLVERESPIGGGFSTIPTVSGEDLTNGNMESGTSSWSLHDTEGAETLATEATIFHGGSGSIKVIVDAHDEGVKQNITVANGTSCNTLAWVYVPKGTDPSDVKLYAKEEGSDYTTYASISATTNDTWELLQLSYTKGSDGNDLRVSVSSSTPTTASVTFYVDDASTVCGAPSTSHQSTGLTASTQYNYRISAINTIGTGSSSTADATTTAATGGTGEAYGVKVGSGVTIGPGCSLRA